MSITITSNDTTTDIPIIPKDIEAQYVTAEQKGAETESQDSDYNPNDETDPSSEDVSSDEASNIENIETIADGNEESIVFSQEFQYQLAAAIENVKYIAKIDKETILERARQDYIDETGQEPTDKQMADAFQTVAIESTQQEIEERVSKEEKETILFQKEFAEALKHIHKIGKIHQEIFVEKVCNTFLELNGKDPTIEELSNTFQSIRNNFAAEAKEEFIEINDGASDSDSDYEITNEEIKQIESDNKIDKRQRTEIVYVNDEDDYTSESDYTGASDADISDEDYDDEELEEDSDDSENYDPEQDEFDYSKDVEDYENFKNELNGIYADENEIECDDEDTIDID